LSHTGSLVGADGVIDAVLRTHGVTRVANVDEMFEALAVFHTRRLPRGSGLAAVSVSGGAAGLMSDLADQCGVQFAPLDEATRARLRAVVPEFGTVGNPLDVTGQGVFQPELLERSLDLLADDPGVDAIVYARSFPARLDAATPTYGAINRAIEHHPEIPFVAMSLAGGHFFPSAVPDTPMQQPLVRLDDVPFLQGAEYGLKAVGALMRYAEFQRGRAAPERAQRFTEQAASARAVVERATGARLSAAEGAAVLSAYGLAAVAEVLTTSPEDAVAAAERFGYPVAAKVEAPSLAHKARVGGVALNLATPQVVSTAFDRLRGLADDAVGVLIQPMVSDPRAEVILGMSQDAQFGPVIACGLGGVFVETLRDVQLLLPPVTEADAHAALSHLRGAALLDGTDVGSIVHTMVAFSQLCLDLHDVLRAVDLNPLMVRAPGEGAWIVDSLFELRC
jgi:acetyltransferase